MNKKTKIKLSLSDRIFNVVNIFIMLVIMAVMLAPIIHVVCVSFSWDLRSRRAAFSSGPTALRWKATRKCCRTI